MNPITIHTNNHLGDTVILTAAIANLQDAVPGIRIRYHGNYSEVFAFAPVFVQTSKTDLGQRVAYHPYSQRTGNGGTCVEAFTRSLFRIAGVQVPDDLVYKVPPLYVSDERRRKAADLFAGMWILNANWQECSQTKGYSRWQEVVDICSGFGVRFVRIGGKEDRDRGYKLNGTIDMRGRTSIGDLISMASVCRGIVSPASAIVHISAAFNKPTICITGAREPAILTGYSNVRHITSQCGLFSRSRGCMAFRMEQCRMPRNGFPSCMESITPETIAYAVRELT